MLQYWVNKLCFIISYLLCSTGAFCQSQYNLTFQHFTSENGLSENFIYTTYQDKMGFLWIGTHDGLNRYDGYGFKKFKHDAADSNSLPDNTIYSICEDGQGNLWMGTGAGLCKYEPSTGLFTTITLNKKLKSVEQVIPIDGEEFLLRHERRLCLINIMNQKELPLNYGDSNNLHPASSSRYSISKDNQGNIYIIKPSDGNAEIFKYDKQNKWLTKFCTLSVPEKPVGQAGFFYIDSRNRCWVPLADKKTHTYDLSLSPLHKEQPLQPLSIFITNAVKYISEDGEGNTWIATNKGLLYHDRSSNEAHWFKQDTKNASSISSNDVQHIFQDRTGIIWIATANGLNKLNPFQKKFRHLTRAQNSEDGLYNNFVLGIFRDRNEGIRIHYNVFENEHFSRYDISNQRFKHIANDGYDAAGWIREMMVQNPERLTDKLLQRMVVLFQERYGRSWMKKGIDQIWIDSEQFPWYSNERFNPVEPWLRDTLIEAMQLYGNDLWAATQKGLIQFNTLTKTSKVYNAGVAGNNNISSNDITCFVFEEDGNIWIGTKGGGLNFFDRKKNSFYHFTEKDGLCNNSIYCMVKDNNGGLWIGTSFGLSNFDPATKKFKNYFRADGLVNNEYNRKSACKMPDGTVFMGGMDGIDFFHPDSLFRPTRKPQVAITDFKLFNKSILLQENYLLKHSENFISIEFAAMDFTNPVANKFAYKLEGADKDWVYPERNNFATYSYLEPGEYKFLVKAANSEGIWNDEPVLCRFTIIPARYQTGWFISLLILTVAAIIYMLFRYRLAQKLHVLQIRNRLHRDLHDDIGATLSSVKAYSEILKDNPDNPVIAGLIRDNSTDMLDRLEVIAWATNPQHDNFKSLKSIMIKFATPVCHANNIEFHLDSTVGEEMMIPGEIRQNIFFVFKEAINNINKYAAATHCSTSMFIKGSQFFLQVTDNGKGFDGIIKGTGNGWKNMKKRGDELGGGLSIESSPGNGTNILLSLPYPFKIPRSWDRNKAG